MNAKNLLTVTSIMLLLVAVAWVAVPDMLFQNFAIAPTGDLRYMGWRYAAYIIGLAVTTWMARDATNSPAGRAVLMGGFLTILITGGLSVYAALTRSPMAWSAGGIELLLALWYVYVLFIKREA